MKPIAESEIVLSSGQFQKQVLILLLGYEHFLLDLNFLLIFFYDLRFSFAHFVKVLGLNLSFLAIESKGLFKFLDGFQ